MFEASRTVAIGRAELEQHVFASSSKEVALSRLAFGSRERVDWRVRYSIEVIEKPWMERSIGAILFQPGGVRRKDPIVDAYLGIKIVNGTFFEGLVTVDDRKSLTFFQDGSLLGSVVEVPEEVERPTSLWKRLFRGRRKWRVFLGQARCGEIHLQYPVDIRAQLQFRLQDDVQLPISISYRANCASGGGKPMAPFRGFLGAIMKRQWPAEMHRDTIIPLNTPCYDTLMHRSEIERMHFLLNVAFRTYYFHLDLCEGS
jgi:hypothetical protein